MMRLRLANNENVGTPIPHLRQNLSKRDLLGHALGVQNGRNYVTIGLTCKEDPLRYPSLAAQSTRASSTRFICDLPCTSPKEFKFVQEQQAKHNIQE